MLPVFFNVTDECLKNLRQLELEAYSILVSVLVAQGPLTTEKKKLLKDAGRILHVCTDRHKLEVRRAVNDDRLNAIAYHVCGTGISTEDWCHEGSRTLSVMQRIAPQTLRPIVSRTSFEIEPVSEKCEGAKETPNSEQKEPYTKPMSSTFDLNRAKKTLGKGQKVMIVPNSQSTTTNSILHKTLSVPMTKVTKLNLDKFKIIPNNNPAASALQVATIKSGSFKVLPLKGKFIGKNVTMARITPIHDMKSVVPPLTMVSSNEDKAEADNTHQKASDEQKPETIKENDPGQPQDDDANGKNEDCLKEDREGEESLPKLMDIDTNELIESEINIPTAAPVPESKED
ncbi:uncharacterized protein LOC143200261 isoform X1 [Rhynchophorus ferrugineus]|uniref:uncharacterized protein LOC143200261 isoform X1 n=1 Tax=Rhynchophorus ferrugineus TaxID=354439 RepID=UPI003FCDC930